MGGLRDTISREHLVERFGAELDRPLRALSKGNRQKIGIVLAVMRRPALLVLDEPTSGRDPLLRDEFGSLVRGAVDEGRTVFLSSQDLDEVQRRTMLIGTSLGAALRLFRIVVVYPSFRHDASISEMVAADPTAAAAFGLTGSITTPVGWLGVNMSPAIGRLLVLLMVVGYGAYTIAGRWAEGLLPAGRRSPPRGGGSSPRRRSCWSWSRSSCWWHPSW